MDEQSHGVVEGHVLDVDEKVDGVSLEFLRVAKPIVMLDEELVRQVLKEEVFMR